MTMYINDASALVKKLRSEIIACGRITCSKEDLKNNQKLKIETILQQWTLASNEASNKALNDVSTAGLLTLDELPVIPTVHTTKDWGLRLSNLINIINTKFGKNEKGTTQNIHIYVTSCRSEINNINFAPFINESITKNINKFMCAKNLAKIGYLEKYMTAVQPTELLILNCSKIDDVKKTHFEESAAYKIGLLSVKDTALTTIHPDLIASKLLNEFINNYVILPYKHIITPEAYKIIHVSPIRFVYIIYQLLIRHYHKENTAITKLVKLTEKQVTGLFDSLVTNFKNITTSSKHYNINEFLLKYKDKLDEDAPFYSVFNNLLHSSEITVKLKTNIFRVSHAIQTLSDIVLALYVDYIDILDICKGNGLGFHSGKLKFIEILKEILPESHTNYFEAKQTEIYSKIKRTLQVSTSSAPIPSVNKQVKKSMNALNISKSLKSFKDASSASKGASAKASPKGVSEGAASDSRPKNSSELLIYQNCWTVANNLFYLTIPGTGLVSYNHINLNKTPDYTEIPLLEKKLFLGDTSVSAEYLKKLQQYQATEFPLKEFNTKEFKPILENEKYVYKGNGNPYISVPIRTLYYLPY